MKRRWVAGPSSIVMGVILCLGTDQALGGSLAPPPGLITPTMKTLEEIEPRIPIGPDTTPGDMNATFIISNPGSYYLTDNLTGEVGKHGIRITTGHVTFDLNGFGMQGAGSSNGIDVPFGVSYVRIHGGVIEGWNEWGVFFTGGGNHHLSDLDLRSNGSGGASVGQSSSFRHCVSILNGGPGLIATDFAVIEGCVADQNNGDQITAGPRSIVTLCSAFNGMARGIVGGEGSRLDSCVSVVNLTDGISTGPRSLVRHCVARFNNGAALVCGEMSLVIETLVVSNAQGGILAGSESMVDRCASISNFGGGIVVDSRSLVSRCFVRDTKSVGGIVVTGAVNWIDENRCIAGTDGVVVTGSFGLITRNSSAPMAGQSYDIVGAMNNRAGTITTSPTSAGPWDNFEF